MSLLLAPYNDSMRLGMGFNSYTQTLCIDGAVTVAPGSVEKLRADDPSQTVTYSSRLVETLGELVDSMSISYSSSIKKGTVEIGGSASAINEDKIKSSDINAVVSVKVVNQTTILTENVIFQATKDVAAFSPRFNEIYGDCYISGFIEGGEFTGIASIRSLDRSKTSSITTAIKSSLSAGKQEDFTLDAMNFGGGGLSSSVLKDTETTISISWMGGGQVKEPKTAWDLDSMFTAAAAFPASVAACPQRTWAILTKYKANKSFVEQWQEGNKLTPLEYDNVASYTAELFDSYMEYKQLLKQVQYMMANPDNYKVQQNVHNAIPPEINTLVAVRSALRNEMNKIVRVVDILAKNPEILKISQDNDSGPTNSLVRSIVLESSQAWQDTADSKTVGDVTRLSAFPGPQSVLSDTSTVERTDKSTKANTLTDVNEPTDLDEGATDKSTATEETAEDKPMIDFAKLLAPEIWAKLLPVLKPGIDPGQPSKQDSVMPMPAGFPPIPGTNAPTQPDPVDPSAVKHLLKIEAAAYGGVDVTEEVRNLVTEGCILELNTDQLGAILPATPLGDWRVLSLMYRWDTKPRYQLAIMRDHSGIFKFTPSLEPAVNTGAIYYPQPEGNSFPFLYSAIYGDSAVSNQGRFVLFHALNTKEAVEITNETMGGDPWVGTIKSVAVFYQKVKDGPIFVATAAERSTLRWV
ncbi:hypothetical protein MMC17_002593 [Xylographa soralifera]|nr:hypothetical protein [Xylographa soralifera]